MPPADICCTSHVAAGVSHLSDASEEPWHVQQLGAAHACLGSSTIHSQSRTTQLHRFQVDKALKIFQDMIAHGCERNVITYSSLINACEKSGRWQLALQLFDDMQRDGCHPNVVSYNVLVSTCAQGEPACAVGGIQHGCRGATAHSWQEFCQSNAMLASTTTLHTSSTLLQLRSALVLSWMILALELWHVGQLANA